MDTKSPKENKAILHAFVNQEDPHVVGLVGIEALDLLSQQMPTEKFKDFLQDAIQSAGQMKQAMQQQASPQAGPSSESV